MPTILSQAALTRYETVAPRLGLTSANITAEISRAEIEQMIDAVSGALVTDIRRPLHYVASTTERVAGYGSPMLMLDRAPITAVSSIALMNSDGTVGSTYDATSYEIHGSGVAGIIYHTGSVWPHTCISGAGFGTARLSGYERKSIRVIYASGYITPHQASTDGGSIGTRDLPYELEEVVIRSVVSLWSNRLVSDQVSSETTSDRSTTYDVQATLFSPFARDVLNRYRRIE